MARKKKYEDYLRKYGRMSAKAKVVVLQDAIEFMQQYNGRSVNDCIVLAMAPDYETAMDAINEVAMRGDQDNLIIA